MAQWFVSKSENVKGPFSGDEIKAQVSGGTLPLDCLIWGRGQKDWIPLSRWIKDAGTQNDATATPASQEQLWHYALDGASKGPMTRAELVNDIKALKQKDEVLVWTRGMKAWADLFEFHDLLDEVGLNRREHPRAPIHGQGIIKIDDTHTIIGQLKTISTGGTGITQVLEPLAIGQTVSIEIRSNELGDSITAKAVVQYITQAGYVGFKFSSLSMENKARIMQYVKQVNQGVTVVQAA
jgi:hypothetical protein